MADEATHVGVETVGEWYRQLAEEAGKGLLDLEIGSDLPRSTVAAGNGYYRRDIPDTQLSIERSYHCSGSGWYPNRTYSRNTTVTTRSGTGRKGIISLGQEFIAAGKEWGVPSVAKIDVFCLRPDRYAGKKGLGLVACSVGISYDQEGIRVWRPEGLRGIQHTLASEEPVSAVKHVGIGNEFLLSAFPDVVRHRLQVVGSMITQRCDLSTALGQSKES